MIPPRLRSRLVIRRRQRIVVDVLETELIFSYMQGDTLTGGARLPRFGADRVPLGFGVEDEVLMRLPVDAVLRRRVVLPAAKGRNLDLILSHELRRHSPVELDKVYVDRRLIERDKTNRKVDFELRMVKREVVDDALSLVRSLGLTPIALGFFGDDHLADRRSFPIGRRPLFKGGMVMLAPLLVPVFLAVVTLIAMQSRANRDLANLQSLVAKERAEQAIVEALRRNIDEARQKTLFLPMQKQFPLVSKILAETSRLLPDGSWLYELQINSREVRLYGYSPASSSLIGLFDGSGTFGEARFRAPLTPGPRPDLERFDLSFVIREDKK